MNKVVSTIQEYLIAGGLFNPEMMDHDKVRNLLIDCKTEIEKLENQLDVARGEREPEAFPDGATSEEVLDYVLMCAKNWAPAARIIGNARAGDIVRAIQAQKKEIEELRWSNDQFS